MGYPVDISCPLSLSFSWVIQKNLVQHFKVTVNLESIVPDIIWLSLALYTQYFDICCRMCILRGATPDKKLDVYSNLRVFSAKWPCLALKEIDRVPVDPTQKYNSILNPWLCFTAKNATCIRCEDCKEEVKPGRENFVQCEICGLWVHIDCQNVTQGPYPVCSSCNAMPLNVLIHKKTAAIQQEMVAMKERMNAMEQKMIAMEEKMKEWWDTWEQKPAFLVSC